MNRDNFNELVENIDDLKSSDIASLESLKEQYPYFQSLHLLIAKAYKLSQHELHKPSLNSAAVYSVDRAYLKKVLEGDFQFIDVIHSKPIENNTSKPTIIPQPKVKSAPTKTTTEQSEVVEKPEIKKSLLKDLDNNLEQYQERKKIMQEFLADNASPATKPATVKQKLSKTESQVQLIEKFIKNEPQMVRNSLMVNESKTDQEDLAKKKLQQSDKFITETLADLLVVQEKYSKAIKIYEKLMVKFPKKTTYFAAQIEKINQRGNV